MRKILVANPFGLGDVIFSMFLVEALRRQSPSAVIDFLANERTEALVRLNPSIRKVHVLDRDGLRSLWPGRPAAFWRAYAALWGGVRAERYDVLLDLSLGREFALHGLLAGIRRRIGLDYRGRGIFLTQRIPLTSYEGRSVVSRQLELLSLAGVSVPELDGRLPLRISAAAQEAARVRRRDAGLADRMLVALAPGGGRSWGPNAVFKQWAPERFAEIARRLDARGLGVALLGDAPEKELLERVRAQAGLPAMVCAGLPIGEAAAVISSSAMLLANDGGLAHLACALGVKTAVIFGPVDERAYAPFMPPPGSTVLVEPVACRPCYAQFRFPPCTHTRACLEGLSVERVWKAVSEMV